MKFKKIKNKRAFKNKILILLITVFNAQFLISQSCNISGPSSLVVGTQQAFSVNNFGQCTNCYDWDVTGPVSIVGSDMKKNVVIQANGPGEFTLCVTGINESGCSECCITGIIVDPDPICCEPQLEGFHDCKFNSTYGKGLVFINWPFYDDGTLCNDFVDELCWTLNGADFDGGPLDGANSGCVSGADKGSWSFNSPACFGEAIHAELTVTYTNGCPPFTTAIDIEGSCACFDGKIISISPNPSISYFEVSIDESMINSDSELQVIDISTNKIIVTKSDVSSNETITIPSNLRGHTFMVHLLENNQVISSQKVISIKN